MSVKLLLPVLFPSWRFFSSIGPSPRIEVAFVVEEDASPNTWIPFRPIPSQLTFIRHLIRLFHNPVWNELLYINTCAERLFEGADEFYLKEIANRLLHAIQRGELAIVDDARFMHFRILAVYSEDAASNQMGSVRTDVFLQSQAYRLGPLEHS